MSKRFHISILAENTAYRALYSEWGFSVLIEDLSNNKKFLFDTGHSGTCVLENAKDLKKDLTHLDGVVLSHGHYDHVYGLEKVLENSKPTTIFAHPEIFNQRYSVKKDKRTYTGMRVTKDDIENHFHCQLCLSKDFFQISPSLYMTGEVPFTNSIETIPPRFQVKWGEDYLQDIFPDDNNLVLDTDQGLVIIFGCAHRGIVNIISHVKQVLNKPVYGIVGGTHLHEASKEQFDFTVEYLRNENLKLIAPAHCTGINRIFDLKQIFNNRVVPAFCGESFWI